MHPKVSRAFFFLYLFFFATRTGLVGQPVVVVTAALATKVAIATSSPFLFLFLPTLARTNWLGLAWLSSRCCGRSRQNRRCHLILSDPILKKRKKKEKTFDSSKKGLKIITKFWDFLKQRFKQKRNSRRSNFWVFWVHNVAGVLSK